MNRAGGAGETPWIGRALADGLRALDEGRPEHAAALCRKVLEAAPRTVEAHFLVGLVALALEDRRSAVAAFGSVTRLRPDHAPAWAQLARLFLRMGQVNRADRALAEAVTHEAGDPRVQDLIGSIHGLLGDQQAALSWYRRAVAGDPEQTAYRVNLANAMVFLGDVDGAVGELERVIARSPVTPQAHWILAGARRAADRRHVDTMRRLAARPGLSPHAQAFLYYAIGKELEDLESWDEAFDAFAEGARQRRRTVRYDESVEQAMFDALAERFTPAWLAAGTCGAGAAAGPQPIFVVGQPRTGTTLVERVLSAHSHVHSAGELQQFGLAIRRLSDYQGTERFSAELVDKAADIEPAALGEAYLRASRPMQGNRTWFVDKLPGNYLFVPLILRALPQAKIVHLVRDPMDACFASFKQLFADAYPHSYDQQEMARHFVRYHRLMALWRERFPGRFVDVSYEDFVADLAPRAKSLLASLGLPWEEACLDFHRQPGAVATASAVQVREPAHTRSVGRWRRYRTHLAPMRQVLLAGGVPPA